MQIEWEISKTRPGKGPTVRALQDRWSAGNLETTRTPDSSYPSRQGTECQLLTFQGRSCGGLWHTGPSALAVMSRRALCSGDSGGKTDPNSVLIISNAWHMGPALCCIRLSRGLQRRHPIWIPVAPFAIQVPGDKSRKTDADDQVLGPLFPHGRRSS